MIKESAIKIGKELFTGRRHCDCFKSVEAHLSRMIDGKKEVLKNTKQGFVTDDGKFLTRKQAAKHAIRCGQIQKTKWGDQLYSEDLY